ncbi:MAG: transporter substrate-binding domain-containing protein [Betaproteobacteria bacterium]|nr:transporter substrate-binding domain-containing protein [Betaproteobacteria bacterium]
MPPTTPRPVARARGLLCAALLCLPAATPAEQAREHADLDLERITAPARRDFAQMKQVRLVRALLPHSRTLFYLERGAPRGLSAELVREFEVWLNRKYRRELGARPISVVLIPVPRETLLQRLVEGRGDLAVANLTITPLREQLVEFSVPELQGVSEIVVTGPASPPLAALEDLAGREVHVRLASSYYESLTALSARFVRERRAPLRLRIVPDALEDEDLMEMLAAGQLSIIVVDDWKAQLWAKILPKIEPRPQLALRTGADIGWAFRKDSSALASEVNAFLGSREHAGKITEWQLLETRRRIKRIENNTRSAEWKKFQEMLALFQKYGARYHIDPLMLAAQGYRESRLSQNARSAAGAVGVMQLLPSTGKAMGVGDIRKLEPNIHAGAKYLRRLMDRYFDDPEMDEQNRTLFAMAGYNAGPTRVSQLRREAGRRGLDAHVWFDNVEVTVGRSVGREPVYYVRDIFKYYVAYKLHLEAREEVEAARENLREAR